MKQVSNETYKKFAKNVLMFTAPALFVFFAQLSQGVDPKMASGVALLALYGLVADLMKKLSK